MTPFKRTGVRFWKWNLLFAALATRSLTKICPGLASCISRAAMFTSLPNTPYVRRVGPPYAPAHVKPLLMPICMFETKPISPGGDSSSTPAATVRSSSSSWALGTPNVAYK